MAQFITDFSEYADTSELYNDWTLTREFSSSHWVLSTGTGTTGDQYQFHNGDEASSGVRAASMWESLGSFQDTEAVVKLRAENGTQTFDSNIVFIRGDLADSSNNSYQCVFNPGGDGLRLEKDASGTTSTIATDSGAANPLDQWVWLRFRANGTNLSVKTWVDGNDEPASWDIETTDSDVSGGYVGVGRTNEFDFLYDVVGVGTNGDPAPMPGGGVPTAPSNLQLTEV